MFGKRFLNSPALMCVCVLASVSLHAKEIHGVAEEEVPGAQTISIAALPNELLDHVLSFLSVEAMFSAGHVCKSWDALATFHNGRAPRSSLLFETRLSSRTYAVPDKEMAITLYFQIKQSGFAPLQNVFISPNQYPKGTRLLNHKDLEAHPETLSAWHNALFGQTPQDDCALGFVMSALPQILVQEQTSLETLECITSYVKRLGKKTRFMRFTGEETQEDIEALKESNHTLVVRAHDLQNNKDTLRALLDTRYNHRVVLSLDSEVFLQEGVLDISKDDIPWSLHHLTLSDPFGKVSAIENGLLWGSPQLASFDARGFEKLTVIRGAFLAQCTGLIHFDARGFANLKIIHGGFLGSCESLTHLDARGFAKLEIIGNNFLIQCTDLTTVNTCGFSNLKTIGHGFLWSCISLESLETKPLGGLETVGDSFLAYCTNLAVCDTDHLTSLRSIGQKFLLCTGIPRKVMAKVEAFLRRVRQGTEAGA